MRPLPIICPVVEECNSVPCPSELVWTSRTPLSCFPFLGKGHNIKLLSEESMSKCLNLKRQQQTDLRTGCVAWMWRGIMATSWYSFPLIFCIDAYHRNSCMHLKNKYITILNFQLKLHATFILLRVCYYGSYPKLENTCKGKYSCELLIFCS